MARVAACNDCGARFKVPDSTTASKAKCPKCGGVLAIPSAEAGAPAAPAAPTKPAAAKAAPARPAAPQPAAPSAPRAAAGRKAPAAKAAPVAGKAPAAPARPAKASASAGRKGGSKAGAKGGRKASSGRGRRGKGGGEGKSGGNPAMLFGILAVVILGGGAAWWFMKDDGAATTPTTDGTANVGTAADGSAPADGGASGADAGSALTDAGVASTANAGSPGLQVAPPAASTEPAPVAAAAAAADDASGSSDDTGETGNSSSGLSALDSLTSVAATTGDSDQAAAPAVTQAPAAKSSKDQDLSEPRPTLIELEPFGPAPGTSQADFDAWSKLVLDLYVTDGGAAGRTRKRLKAELDEVDVVNATPAYINAANGLDIKDESDLQVLFILVRDWQERVGSTPRFYFNGDVTDRSVVEQNKRLIVIDGWRKWWSDTIKTEDTLAAYREKMEDRRDG